MREKKRAAAGAGGGGGGGASGPAADGAESWCEEGVTYGSGVDGAGASVRLLLSLVKAGDDV